MREELGIENEPEVRPDHRLATVLCTACQTLNRAPARLLRTVEVRVSMADGAGLRTVEAWSRELADMYGLRASVEVDGGSLVVRFFRNDYRRSEE